MIPIDMLIEVYDSYIYMLSWSLIAGRRKE
jgi:hypothetical protein